ncbi:MAG: class I SAM-dependent methyltransferase [Nanoarchaeota archaeon]
MNISENNKQIWENFYRNNKRFLYYPSEDLVAFFSTYFKNNLGNKKVLDIGCGAGRNLLLAEKLGAETYGIDSSKEAINEARKFLTLNQSSSNIQLGKVTNIPYSDNLFDISILWGVFHYLSKADQEIAKEEIKRVMKNDAWIVFTLRSIHDSRYGVGEELNKNVFIQNKPGRKGIVIQYWDEEGARSFFNLENLLIGERIRAPIGRLEVKSSHWTIAGRIKKNG